MTGHAASPRIRLADDHDAGAITEVLRAAFLEFEPLYTPDGYAATTPGPDQVRGRMQDGPVWVALHDDRVVGTGSAVLRKAGLYLRGMGVRPDARGSGIGRLLLAQIEAFAADHQVDRMYLSTTPFLTGAIRLYKTFGFRRVEEGPHDLFGTPLFTMEKRRH